MECIYVALARAYSRVWYVAPFYRQAEMVAWKLLLKTIPTPLIKRQNNMKLEIELWNGSLIELKGAENEDSLRGPGLHFCVLDEYAFMRHHVWGKIIQPMFAATRGRALFIGTPDGKNHFYELWLEGQQADTNYKSFRFKSTDSQYVDKEYIESEKKRLPDNIFKQEYEASFEDFTGLIYPEFDYSMHVIDPFNVPSFWNRVHAMDPAMTTGTTAALFSAIDEEGNIIVYDEYYQKNLVASDHAQVILMRYDKDKDMMIIDPHARNKVSTKEGNFFAPIDEYRDAGINPVLGETHVDAGINRVREFLKVDTDDVHPFKPRTKGKPKLFIFSSCKKLIWEFEKYRYADRPESKLGIMRPVPVKKDDHLMDSLRYLCMSRAGATKVKKELKFGEKSLHAYLKRDKQKTKGFA